MKRLILSTGLTCALSTGPTMANPVSCSYGDLSRTIEVVYSNPGQAVPCEVIYHKPAEGSIATLWRANTESGYCEAQAAGLREKLEVLGWECSAQMSAGEAALPLEADSEG